MVMFDSVYVSCPKCGKEKEFQSKSGDCLMYVYDLKDCPDDTLLNVNRHSPYTCKCGTVFEVDINNRKSIEYDRTK